MVVVPPAAARLATQNDLFDEDKASRCKAKGPKFSHYRRSRLTKAPRKRTFIMHMTKYPDAWISALASPTCSELNGGGQVQRVWITSVFDFTPGAEPLPAAAVSKAVSFDPVADQITPTSSSVSRRQSPFAVANLEAKHIQEKSSDTGIAVSQLLASSDSGQVSSSILSAGATGGEAKLGPGTMQLLGSGAQGEVYMGYRNGAPVAFKYPAIAVCQRPESASNSLKSFEREVAILTICKHPNVVDCLDVCRDGPRPYIIEEYAARGSIHDWLYSKDHPSRAQGMAAIVSRAVRQHCSNSAALVDPLASLIFETTTATTASAAAMDRPGMPTANLLKYIAILQILYDIASALSYLHTASPKVVHRDLKPDNILLTEAGVAKVADFGVAKLICDGHLRNETTDHELFGTANYAAPEDLWGSPDQVGPAADIYSLGCVAWECLAGECPWMGCSEYSIMFSVGQGTRQLAVPDAWPAGAKALLQQCLAFDPSERPSAAQVQDVLQAELQQAMQLLAAALRKN